MTTELNVKKDFFNALAELKEIGLVKLSPQGEIINWSPGARHITGYSALEVDDTNISFLYNMDEYSDNTLDKHLRVAQVNGKLETEKIIRKKDGTNCYVKIIYTPLMHDNNILTGYAMILTDITERKKLEEELQQLKKQATQHFS